MGRANDLWIGNEYCGGGKNQGIQWTKSKWSGQNKNMKGNKLFLGSNWYTKGNENSWKMAKQRRNPVREFGPSISTRFGIGAEGSDRKD